MSLAKTLAGKVAVVTGGASGIGLAITHRLLGAGAKVAVFDIKRNADLAESDTLHHVDANIMSEESLTAGVNGVVSKWGSLDVLVNNAGVMDRMSRTADTTNDVWDRCLAINVTGPFHLTRLAIHHFLEQETRGSIVNICSTAAVRGSAAGAAYTTSKHALLGLTRSTAWGYAKDGIRCNTVLPGGVTTGIMQNIDIDQQGFEALKPFMGIMPGMCEPDDIAAAVLFLAGATAVNGAELQVDQGWTTS